MKKTVIITILALFIVSDILVFWDWSGSQETPRDPAVLGDDDEKDEEGEKDEEDEKDDEDEKDEENEEDEKDEEDDDHSEGKKAATNDDEDGMTTNITSVQPTISSDTRVAPAASAESGVRYITKTVKVTRHDHDGDGLWDEEDPHPDIHEKVVVVDDDRNGIVDTYE